MLSPFSADAQRGEGGTSVPPRGFLSMWKVGQSESSSKGNHHEGVPRSGALRGTNENASSRQPTHRGCDVFCASKGYGASRKARPQSKPLAQSVEHPPSKRTVADSKPAWSSNRKPFLAVRESVLILDSSENQGTPEVESRRSVHEVVVQRVG